jgi:hypothetical protein
VRSNVLLVVALLFAEVASASAPPADKRTILTSGEKVYTLKYSLGQSTILYFGVKPEIVICGNKNYFNIEKIKDGITIQPLSNFSTNLTVISGGRRYLFYLTPSGGTRPDGFVEVKWIPPSEAKPVELAVKRKADFVTELGIRTKIPGNLEIVIARFKQISSGSRKVIEMELISKGQGKIETKAIEIIALDGGKPIERQVLVWEDETVENSKPLKGRIIFSSGSPRQIALAVGFAGKNTRMSLKGLKYRQ